MRGGEVVRERREQRGEQKGKGERERERRTLL